MKRSDDLKQRLVLLRHTLKPAVVPSLRSSNPVESCNEDILFTVSLFENALFLAALWIIPHIVCHDCMLMTLLFSHGMFSTFVDSVALALAVMRIGISGLYITRKVSCHDYIYMDSAGMYLIHQCDDSGATAVNI